MNNFEEQSSAKDRKRLFGANGRKSTGDWGNALELRAHSSAD